MIRHNNPEIDFTALEAAVRQRAAMLQKVDVLHENRRIRTARGSADADNPARLDAIFVILDRLDALNRPRRALPYRFAKMPGVARRLASIAMEGYNRLFRRQHEMNALQDMLVRELARQLDAALKRIAELERERTDR